MTPLCSVIIPTHNRPNFLGRAISSALGTAAGLDVDVVVVPNGGDRRWRVVADNYKSDPRVRWLPLQVANASAARNRGLESARGKYVRFLDDDDYLLPAAASQLQFIHGNNLDLCSAPLESTAPNGQHLFYYNLPDTTDFVAAAFLSIGISGFTQGSIFRKSSIGCVRWRENISLYDDYFWMLDLAASRELSWNQTAEPVGSYVQHDGSRLSRIRRSGLNSRLLSDAILQLHSHLGSTGRHTPERVSAVATALLSHAHSAFPANPAYLGSIIRKALAIDPDAIPLHPVFKKHPWLGRHLLVAEWSMLPARYLTRGYRRATWSVGTLLSRVNN